MVIQFCSWIYFAKMYVSVIQGTAATYMISLRTTTRDQKCFLSQVLSTVLHGAAGILQCVLTLASTAKASINISPTHGKTGPDLKVQYRPSNSNMRLIKKIKFALIGKFLEQLGHSQLKIPNSMRLVRIAIYQTLIPFINANYS